MNISSRTLMIALCLIGTVYTKIVDNSLPEETQRSLIQSSIEGKMNDSLIEQWQDYVLANAVVASYVNILMVLASKSDFPLVNSSNFCTAHIQSPNSFRQTISQLADSIRRVLLSVYEDMNRIQIGLERIPMHLKTILLLIKKGSKESINTVLPNLLKQSEKIVNESIIILKNPKTKFEQVKHLIAELDSLITIISSDNIITLQVQDVKTQWIFLTDLFTQLAIQAEATNRDFLHQFNWILKEFIRPDIPFMDNYRDLIINLLQPKVIEIDRSTDLLSLITKTYTDISIEYTNEKMIGNTHLILLSNEQERKEYIKQSRYDLPLEAVKIARLALKRHDEFIRRDEIRQIIYENFLNEMSQNDLMILLSINEN